MDVGYTCFRPSRTVDDCERTLPVNEKIGCESSHGAGKGRCNLLTQACHYRARPPSIGPYSKAYRRWFSPLSDTVGCCTSSSFAISCSAIGVRFLGFVWTLLNPLLFMLVYTLVFSVYFKSGIANFPVFLIAGLIPWQWFGRRSRSERVPSSTAACTSAKPFSRRRSSWSFRSSRISSTSCSRCRSCSSSPPSSACTSAGRFSSCPS